MIILPDKNIVRTKALMPIPRHEWKSPSQRSSTFGIENVTRWRLRASLHDGFVVWTGWFDDRDDADAFLWALGQGTLEIERELWRLPTPWWRPDLDEELSYDFATVTFLTAPTGSNQTFTSASDWNNGSNKIETLGAGSGGANAASNGNAGGGGAGGAFSGIINFVFATPGTTTATYQIGTAGGIGAAGGDSWFNGATLGASSVGAKGGGAPSGVTGGTGGASGSGVGTTKNSGGNGGTTTFGGGGGGAAAGSSGVGNNGGSAAGAGGGGGGADGGAVGSNGTLVSFPQTGGAGGAGANGGGTGGTGGTAVNTGNATAGAVGGAGTEWDASHGSGGGGGGGGYNGAAGTGGAGGTGGTYGGGGGGGGSSTSGTQGAGIAGFQGIIVLTSFTKVGGFNMPMLGM